MFGGKWQGDHRVGGIGWQAEGALSPRALLLLISAAPALWHDHALPCSLFKHFSSTPHHLWSFLLHSSPSCTFFPLKISVFIFTTTGPLWPWLLVLYAASPASRKCLLQCIPRSYIQWDVSQPRTALCWVWQIIGQVEAQRGCIMKGCWFASDLQSLPEPVLVCVFQMIGSSTEDTDQGIRIGLELVTTQRGVPGSQETWF